jgi:hypothetical protein
LVLTALLILALAGLAVALATRNTSSAAQERPGNPVGRLYTETNDPYGNQVLIFNRYANGKLTYVGAAATGGTGRHQPQPGCTPPGGCPDLDTQGELALTSDGHLLFAVNAGSNQITSFRATSSGLQRVSMASSGGASPNSLTIHGNLLYVLNSNSGNIAGFRFSHGGILRPIPGSSQPLVGGLLPGLPRQVGFDASGNVLMVTLFANRAGPPGPPPHGGGTSNTIDTFPVMNGVAGPGTAHDSTADYPFAFAFDPRDHAIMAQVVSLGPGSGSTASYNVTGSGSVTPIDRGEPTNGFAPCWVVLTTNGRYAYVVNTSGGHPGGATIAEYTLSPSGKLTRLGNTAPRVEYVLKDEALSGDDKYLYVVSPGESNPGSATIPGPTSHIDVYALRSNGTLSLVAEGSPILQPGLTGLVAH